MKCPFNADVANEWLASFEVLGFSLSPSDDIHAWLRRGRTHALPDRNWWSPERLFTERFDAISARFEAASRDRQYQFALELAAFQERMQRLHEATIDSEKFGCAKLRSTFGGSAADEQLPEKG